MGWPDAAGLTGGAMKMVSGWAGQLAALLLSPGSAYSLAAIACTAAIAAAFTLSRRKRGRAVPMKVLVRALFPRRLFRSESGKADLLFSLFNLFVAGLLFGGAILSSSAVAGVAQGTLNSLFGPLPASQLPQLFCSAVITLTLYLAYELSYWLDHYLSHRIPLLWEFHKVHHSAESLSPLTNFRVHPVDTIVFYNIVAIVTGIATGTLNFAFGATFSMLALGGTNILLLVAAVALLHLQHTHLWISFSGRLGRWLLSPAHHQIHHSNDPRHYGRNLGASLAIWDRLFGTLHVPAREREALQFGVPELGYDPHTMLAGLIRPCFEAVALVRSELRQRSTAFFYLSRWNRKGTESLNA